MLHVHIALTVNKALQLYWPISVLLSYLGAIQGHSRCWCHCDAESERDVLGVTKMGSQLREKKKKSKEVRLMTGLSVREVSKTVTATGDFQVY